MKYLALFMLLAFPAVAANGNGNPSGTIPVINSVYFPPDGVPNASIGIGSSALANQTSSGTKNTAVGYQAGSGIVNGSYNSIFGALANASSGSIYNVLMGEEAFTNGNYNVAIGSRANGGSGQFNFSMGYQTANDLQGGSGNVFIGASAGYNGVGENSNIGIGQGSLSGTSYNGLGDFNIGLGANSLSGVNSTSAANNVALGYSALKSITTGASNLGLGFQVGSSTLATGSNNILIGTNQTVDTPTSGTSNFLNIANTIFANGANSGTLNAPIGSVGIGTTATPGQFNVGNASSHAGQATCWTTGGAIGYCTTVVGATGACTCTGL